MSDTQKEARDLTKKSIALSEKLSEAALIECVETGERATLSQWASAFALSGSALYSSAYANVNNCVAYGGRYRGLHFRRVRPGERARQRENSTRLKNRQRDRKRALNAVGRTKAGGK